MSYLDAVSRVNQLESLLAPPALSPPPSAPAKGGFARALDQAGRPAMSGAAPSPGLGALSAAQSQLGVAEQPPGSNDGPQIAQYRSAVAGSYAGAPWCAYFVSWAAAQAGAPIGDGGRGEGSVAGITAWAQRTGRLTSQPQAGDLILFGSHHVGIVESVNADGTLTTIEGNSSDGVHRRVHDPGDASGFVRL
jgi:cell wall-associated NlpC family hydrolase